MQFSFISQSDSIDRFSVVALAAADEWTKENDTPQLELERENTI